MRKIIAIVVAGALATASVAATTESANASSVGAFVLGAVVGAVGIEVIEHHHPFARVFGSAPGYPPAYVADNNHTAWCQSHYRSYNAGSDTFTGYDGITYACVSPH